MKWIEILLLAFLLFIPASMGLAQSNACHEACDLAHLNCAKLALDDEDEQLACVRDKSECDRRCNVNDCSIRFAGCLEGCFHLSGFATDVCKDNCRLDYKKCSSSNLQKLR